MSSDQRDIVEQAIDWHLRRHEMDGAAWHEFVLWLEADPENARAYDAIAQLDDVALSVAPPVAANDDARPRWWKFGAGLATAAAAALVGYAVIPSDGRYVIVTQPGELRRVALADGTRIEVNGGTRLMLDRNDLRVATLEKGEAVFHVHHDAGTPFTLQSGGREIEDAGTVFNASRDGQRFDIQVAEGSVIFEPRGQAVKLMPGQAISLAEGSETVALSKVAVETVGGWRQGTLSYAEVPLSTVQGAIERRYRIKLTLTGGLSRQSFTGMVRLSGDAARDIPHLAALIGANTEQDGSRWIISPKGNAVR